MTYKKTVLIAEAGVNHNGDVALAKELVDAAVAAGADLVKFQTFTAETLVTRYSEKAGYQKSMSAVDESQFEMIKRLELTRDAHLELVDYCKSKGIQFLSTAFSRSSLDFLAELDVPFYKIPSGELTNLPYLRYVSQMGKPVAMSTGMATLEEVGAAMDSLLEGGLEKEHLTILHCSSQYPTPPQDVNLLAMCTIRNRLGVKVGYSDHTLGIEIPIAAVAMGATIIEKHFTLSRALPGPDHAASLEPHELESMVDSIRIVERALGDGEKKPTIDEIRNIPAVRKSVVAKTSILAGELLSEENLTVKRPGTGISPMNWDDLIGSAATKDFEIDELLVK